MTKDEATVRMVPIDRIRVINPRVREPKKFREIVENIRLVGLKRPITLTIGAPGDGGKEMFDLVCGQGRLEAFVALGETEIPALVRGFSKTDALIAGLAENLARRRIRSLDQVRLILWMQEQGQAPAEIAQKTGLCVDYVKDILCLLSKREERLLEAVLHGRIPITIATRLAGVSDEQSQALLIEAYERKEMNQKTLTVFKRLVEQRRYLGKTYGARSTTGIHRTSAESLVVAYKREAQRQRLLVKKAKICEARLRNVAAAFRVLVADEDYVNLLRAEKIETMPKFLADQGRDLT